jgi:hypothetical protein
MCLPIAPTSEWLFVQGLPRRSPKTATITFCSYLQLRQGLKQSCNSCWELSKGVLHSTYTHRGRVNSWLLVIGSQIANLTPGLSFCHNLCCIYSNGSYKLIFDIYTLIAFQWYKKRPNARCFDPCNRTLKFRESRRTPKSPFRECESHPHTLSKQGYNTFHNLWEKNLLFQHLHLYIFPKFTFYPPPFKSPKQKSSHTFIPF